MKSDIDDGHLELSHVVPVAACTHSKSERHSTITKLDEIGSREQTCQVVCQEDLDEPASGCVLRFGDDVVKAWHRKDEPEQCQDHRCLVEQRVCGRRGRSTEPVKSKRARVSETWGGLSSIMHSQCPEDAMHAKDQGDGIF